MHSVSYLVRVKVRVRVRIRVRIRVRHALGLILLGGGVPLRDELLGQRELLVLASLELGAGHDHVELGALGREDLRAQGGLVQDDLVGEVRVRIRVRVRVRVRVTLTLGLGLGSR